MLAELDQYRLVKCPRCLREEWVSCWLCDGKAIPLGMAVEAMLRDFSSSFADVAAMQELRQ